MRFPIVLLCLLATFAHCDDEETTRLKEEYKALRKKCLIEKKGAPEDYKRMKELREKLQKLRASK